jgi:hypothetical protein
MKTEGALEMRFLRHGGIYRPDVSLHLINPDQGAAFRSGPVQAIGHDGRSVSCPSVAMSSGRLFLDRVARQHCPSPPHRHGQNNSSVAPNGIIYHRTVGSVLTLCLTKRGNPIAEAVIPLDLSEVDPADLVACKPFGSINKRGKARGEFIEVFTRYLQFRNPLRKAQVRLHRQLEGVVNGNHRQSTINIRVGKKQC